MNPSSQKTLKKAFRIIRRNFGCPGNDGLSISDIRRSYDHYADQLLEQLETGSFQFEQSPRETQIVDYLGKERLIYVYCVRDRWVQEYLKLSISPYIENVLPDSVFGYRQKRTDIDSYHYILQSDPRHLLRTDISNFFATINKASILKSLSDIGTPSDLVRATNYSLIHCSDGLPQGHVMSCMLSNLSLASFDWSFSHSYARFGDDMMFGCSSRKEVDLRILEIEIRLKKLGFELNQSKIRILENPTISDLL